MLGGQDSLCLLHDATSVCHPFLSPNPGVGTGTEVTAMLQSTSVGLVLFDGNSVQVTAGGDESIMSPGSGRKRIQCHLEWTTLQPSARKAGIRVQMSMDACICMQ